jgi:hypothetical protein
VGIFSRQKYEEGTLRLWTGGSHSLPYAVKWRLGHQAGLDGQEWSELYKGPIESDEAAASVEAKKTMAFFDSQIEKLRKEGWETTGRDGRMVYFRRPI